MKNYPNLNQFVKKGTKGLKIACFICFLVSIVLIVISVMLIGGPTDDPMSLNDSMGGSGNDYCYIDMQFVSECFATYDVNGTSEKFYYFVSDQDFFYVVNIKETDLRTKYRTIYDYSMSDDEDIVEPEPIRITGMSKKLDGELLEVAIESMNEWYGEEVVTDDNAEDVLGTLYLDTMAEPNESGYVFFVAGVIGLFSTVVMLLVMWITSSHNKKETALLTEDDLMTLEEIAETKNYEQFGKTSLYVNDKYLITTGTSFYITKYEDILWVYLYRMRYYGVVTQINLMIGRPNGKVVGICPASKNMEEDLVSLMEIISERNPNCLIGFTKENKQAFKEMTKK